MNKYLRLYSNCLIVRGVKRSTVCDLYRGKIYLISNVYTDFFDQDMIQINSQVPSAFMDFLVSNDLVFETDEDELTLFPKISLAWDIPSVISNAIIDFSNKTEIDLEKYARAFNELDLMNCKTVVFRFFDEISNHTLIEIINEALKAKNSLISICIKYDFSKMKILEELSKKDRIMDITLHNYIGNEINVSNKIKHTSLDVKNELLCGVIKDYYFSINTDHFSEAQSYNTCLNRKICIDSSGEIKNCPSLKKSYGNISNSKLVDAVESSDFKNLWTVNKDKINICKSCEFRYVCSDCRAFLDDPTDIYSKPLKCGYNPNTSEWTDWLSDPKKISTIINYKLDTVYLNE